jgi:hypothetical protein
MLSGQRNKRALQTALRKHRSNSHSYAYGRQQGFLIMGLLLNAKGLASESLPFALLRQLSLTPSEQEQVTMLRIVNILECLPGSSI